MKIKHLLTKTLLVAAGLLLGGANSVWADPTAVYQKTIAQWAASDIGEGQWTTTTTDGFTSSAEANTGLTINVNAANHATEPGKATAYSKTVTTANNSVLHLTATWNTGNATGGANVSLTFGDVMFKFTGQAGKAEVKINNTWTEFATSTGLRGKDWAIDVTINQSTNAVSGTATINGTEYEVSGTTAAAGSFNSISFGIGGSVPNWGNTAILKAISITEEAAAASASVTYKYEDTDGNSLSALKADVVKSEDVGANISDLIVAALRADFMNGDESIKYVYSSYACDDTTVPAGGTTVTLKFAAKAKFTYSVNAIDGESNNLGTLASVSGYAGDTKTLSWSKFLKSGGKWYESSVNNFYKGSITEGGSENVVYNESDIAYFIECESMNGVRQDRWILETNATWSGNTKIRINQYYPTIYTATFEDGGVFDLALPYNNSNSSNHTYQIKIKNGNDYTLVQEWTCEAGSHTYTLEGIVIPAGCALAVCCDGITGNSNARMDYLTLTPTKATATIGTTGYTTFASSYPLNIDGMTASTGTVKAYYVTASDVKSSSVALTDATGNVAAGTGLILEGTAGAAITIPVVAAGTALSGNKLVGCTTATDITKETANYANFYVLSATEAAFKKIKTWVDTPHTLTIPAGKAYLDTTGADVVGAPTLNFDLSGEATGIADVRGKMEDVRSDFFDLQGRKVAQPAKGLYIVNGKKVVIK